ncbi:general stress protein [Pseudomonas tohonis]|uniref:general stress protein n=1 Tax=Pseudomonas tohonis TaxID=2725477 RepID=UPI003A5C1637
MTAPSPNHQKNRLSISELAKREASRTITAGPAQNSGKANPGLPPRSRTMSNKNPGNFSNDREKASEAGRKGGQNSGGNFANDRERASEAGRKGGQKSHGGGRSS